MSELLQEKQMATCLVPSPELAYLNGRGAVAGLHRLRECFIPKDLLELSKLRGDDSFVAPLGNDMSEWTSLPELPPGLVYSDHSGVLLSMRNVHPHMDELVGRERPGFVHAGAVFALLHVRGKNAASLCSLQVGAHSLTLKSGDWVLFNDMQMHCLCAESVWWGLSVQVLAPKPCRRSSTKNNLAK